MNNSRNLGKGELDNQVATSLKKIKVGSDTTQVSLLGKDASGSPPNNSRNINCGLCPYFNPFVECERTDCPPEAKTGEEAIHAGV